MNRARELALAGVLLCVTAAAFAVPALYMPGIALLLAAALASSSVALGARGAVVQLSCSARSVQEGDGVDIEVRLRRGPLPLPGGCLLPWPGAGELPIPRARTEAIPARTFAPRRGRHTVGPARLLVRDPLAICSREVLSGTAELLVMPRVHPLAPAALTVLQGSGRSLRETPQEVDSLRAHRPGSPASRIHWPTVARSGVLMEHAMRAGDEARVLVLLDCERPQSQDALDRAVRAAASICHALARRGGCMLLLPDDLTPSHLGADLHSWPALHVRLALAGERAPVRRTPARERAQTVVVVTAREDGSGPASESDLRVGPCPLDGLPVSFELAGCAAQPVPGAAGRRAA